MKSRDQRGTFNPTSADYKFGIYAPDNFKIGPITFRYHKKRLAVLISILVISLVALILVK